MKKKVCSRCKTLKEIKDFGFRTLKSGQVSPQSFCKACRSGCHKGRSILYLRGIIEYKPGEALA